MSTDDTGLGEPETGNAAGEKKTELRAGEKAFTYILFLAGVFFFYHSLKIWIRMPVPRTASAAAVPLIMSGLWTILTVTFIVENHFKKTPLSGIKSLREKIWKGLQYAFPKEVLVMLSAVVIYCVLLLAGISFYIVTPLFLYGTMCYMMRRGYLLNIVWTAITMAFALVVFRLLFNVIFP